MFVSWDPHRKLRWNRLLKIQNGFEKPPIGWTDGILDSLRNTNSEWKQIQTTQILPIWGFWVAWSICVTATGAGENTKTSMERDSWQGLEKNGSRSPTCIKYPEQSFRISHYIWTHTIHLSFCLLAIIHQLNICEWCPSLYYTCMMIPYVYIYIHISNAIYSNTIHPHLLGHVWS